MLAAITHPDYFGEWEIKDRLIFESAIRKKSTTVGRVVKIQGEKVTFHIFRSKEKFVKNLLKRKVAPWLKLIPKINHNHPLTSIFK